MKKNIKKTMNELILEMRDEVDELKRVGSVVVKNRNQIHLNFDQTRYNHKPAGFDMGLIDFINSDEIIDNYGHRKIIRYRKTKGCSYNILLEGAM